jgi:hypothetical protein
VTPRVVIDGYFASGKSSIAAIVATQLGAALIRPFTDEIAAELFGYLARGEVERFDVRAEEILAEADRAAARAPAVFDRHWLSVLAYLPDSHRERWTGRPQTYCCWADLDVTLRRLVARVEHQPDRALHAHFVSAYRALAEERRVPLIDSSHRTPAQSAELILRDLLARDDRKH